jgi:hypothetical protein
LTRMLVCQIGKQYTRTQGQTVLQQLIRRVGPSPDPLAAVY